jgi:hypothetical protein
MESALGKATEKGGEEVKGHQGLLVQEGSL